MQNFLKRRHAVRRLRRRWRDRYVEKLIESRSLIEQFEVRGTAVLNDHLANDVCQTGTIISGTDDDIVSLAIEQNENHFRINANKALIAEPI